MLKWAKLIKKIINYYFIRTLGIQGLEYNSIKIKGHVKLKRYRKNEIFSKNK